MINHALSRFAVGLLSIPSLWSGPSAALTLEFPGPALEIGTRVEALTSYRMPIGPFRGDRVESLLTEGTLDQRAWRLDATGMSTLQLLRPLREQVIAAGFRVIYECEAVTCGGFDFRYGTEVLPEPEMHVDLGDFRFLAAERKTDDGSEYISLIVSRAVDQGFVQVTRVGQVVVAAPGFVPPVATPAVEQPITPDSQTPESPVEPEVATEPVGPVEPDGSLADRLTSDGKLVLSDLVFPSGSAELAEGTIGSVSELGKFLLENPGARVMLVGHTDSAGDLPANISLSRARARSVRQWLLKTFGIPARQIEAEGVGFLSPRAPNSTEAGRLENRRVEVLLLSNGLE